MEYNLKFTKLCDKLNLGSMTAEPISLTGGHMHKMFALETLTGKYAVKALNPGVMLRPEAMGNLVNAENIAQISAKHISAAPAKTFNGVAIQEIDGQYYYVFDWIDGITFSHDNLTVKHSEIMGNILADLHNIDFSSLCLEDDYSYKEYEFDWDFYLQKGIQAHADWVDLVKNNLANLHDWNKRLIDGSNKLSVGTVISHGDLEPKNVIWKNNVPIVIDWEAAGFIAPSYDLFETAVYWAKDIQNKIQKDRFITFINSYKNRNTNLTIDIDAVLYKGFVRLGWLEYSLKRSLGLESADEAESRMGTDHVFWSINDMLQYEKTIPVLKKWMQEA